MELKELATALTKAQAEIEGAAADKSNPHFRSKYADLGNVIDAIKPALAKYGLSFIQRVHDADDAAKVETVILHASGQQISCGAVSVPVSKKDAQGYGSALTYARRYSLSAAFGVAPEDDDGNAAAKSPPKKTTISPTDGALESQPPEVQEGLRRIANSIVDLWNSGNEWGAFEAAEGISDPEEKVALWSLLKPHSKLRSRLKEMAQEAKQKEAA